MSEDLVTVALRKARYNEIVQITIDEGNDGSLKKRDICLVPCLNEQEGGIIFQDLIKLVRASNFDDSDDDSDLAKFSDEEIILAKELQTKRWFFPMLNDHRRNELYEKSIGHAIRTAPGSMSETNDEKAVVVLDIGCGTGLLSMMAARLPLHRDFSSSAATTSEATAVEDSSIGLAVNVVAVEMSTAISRLALRTVQDNSLSHVISIIEGHSTTLDLGLCSKNECGDGGADVCISELLEDGLLGEGWLPAMRDAWKRHLKPDCVVVPRGARVYAQLAHAEWLPQCAGPYPRKFSQKFTCYPEKEIVEETCSSASIASDNGHLLSFTVDAVKSGNFSSKNQYLVNSSQVVVPVNAEKLQREGLLDLLSDAIQLFDFNVADGGSNIPSSKGRQTTVSCSVVVPRSPKVSADKSRNPTMVISAEKEVHGALVWWELDLCDGVTYSTQPGFEPWQDHWHACLHLFSQTTSVSSGDTIELVARHNDERIFVDLNTKENKSTTAPNEMVTLPNAKRTKIDEEIYIPKSPLISPKRACQLNDGYRLDALYEAISSAFSHLSKSSTRTNGIVVLDVSDYSLGAGLALLLSGASPCRVISIESSLGHLPFMSAQFLALSKAVNSRIHTLSNGNLPDQASTTQQSEPEVIQCYPEQLTMQEIGVKGPVDILCAEPYFEILEGWHLQEAMNFHYIVDLLRSRGLVSASTIVIPYACRIMGCIVQSDQLHSAYSACRYKKEASIGGLDHEFANTVGDRFHRYEMSVSMWEYDFVVLSEVVELGKFTYGKCKSFSSNEEIFSRGAFQSSGRCDALLIWVDYVYHSSDKPMAIDKFNVPLHVRSNIACRQSLKMLDHCPTQCLTVDEADLHEFVCISRFGGCPGPSDHSFKVKICTRDNLKSIISSCSQ